MADKESIQWLSEPAEQDYPAALSYLSLLYDEKTATELIQKLEKAPMARFKAKDVLRASRLNSLGLSNNRVDKDLKKIKDDKPLSPILLVRAPEHGHVVVADGYHRVCAVYSLNEDEWIPCKIV
jgi:hypothetical protein